MKPIAILDTETSGLDPARDRVIEVALAFWSVPHGRMIWARSWLVDAHDAPSGAEDVHGIPREMLYLGDSWRDVEDEVRAALYGAECVIAHNASFDRQWFDADTQNATPWVCSADHIEWPRPSTSRSLVALALAHGVGVVAAHRALDDVMTLVRMLDRVHDMGADVPAMLARALRPRAVYQALVSYDDREQAKAAGFRWDAARKAWLKSIAKEDTASLPFKVREVAA